MEASREDSKLENVLRKVAIGLGLVLLAASIWLSYDGFDQTMTGDNSNYGWLAAAIGIALAITFNALEFILSSKYEGLNKTLVWLGIFAYIYSIATNFIGLRHLLNMNIGIAVISALFMDVVPEPMIAWGLGEASVHDLFDNFGKAMTAPVGKKGKSGGGGGNQGDGNNNHNNRDYRPEQSYQSRSKKGNGGNNYPHGGGRDRRAQLEAQFRQAQKSSQEDLSDTGKFHAVHRNFE